MLSAFSFMQNPYQTLGIDRDATPDEIKRAYRKLASQHHPDKGGDKVKFQDIQVAYDTLSDPQRRAQIDNPDMGGFNQSFGFGPGQPFDFDTIFNVFGARFHHPQQQARVKQQARMSLWITLRDVAQGGKRTVSVGTYQGTTAVEIEIPPGINDGDQVQYSGLGPQGMDLIIQFRIHPDPRWTRSELNVQTDHTINIWQLITGGDTEIRDLVGNTLSLSIPARTQPGTIFRLRGRGLVSRNGSSGDILVRVQASIPDDIDPELLALIERNQAK
jgi:DnaJ-class molecular chaperone